MSRLQAALSDLVLETRLEIRGFGVSTVVDDLEMHTLISLNRQANSRHDSRFQHQSSAHVLKMCCEKDKALAVSKNYAASLNLSLHESLCYGKG